MPTVYRCPSQSAGLPHDFVGAIISFIYDGHVPLACSLTFYSRCITAVPIFTTSSQLTKAGFPCRARIIGGLDYKNRTILTCFRSSSHSVSAAAIPQKLGFTPECPVHSIVLRALCTRASIPCSQRTQRFLLADLVSHRDLLNPPRSQGLKLCHDFPKKEEQPARCLFPPTMWVIGAYVFRGGSMVTFSGGFVSLYGLVRILRVECVRLRWENWNEFLLFCEVRRGQD